MTLHSNIKRYFLISIVICTFNLFSMVDQLVDQTICKHFFYTDTIKKTVQDVNDLKIDAENFIEKKDSFKTLLGNVFTELKKISNYIMYTQDLLLFFDLPETQHLCFIMLNYYYQRDHKLTDFFINTINDIFNFIGTEKASKEEKDNLKMGAFLRIASLPRASQHCSVLWKPLDEKALIYIENLNIEKIQRKIFWYNILARNNAELYTEGITTETKQEIHNAYIDHCKKQNVNSLFNYTTFTCHVKKPLKKTFYKNIVYVKSHKNQELRPSVFILSTDIQARQAKRFPSLFAIQLLKNIELSKTEPPTQVLTFNSVKIQTISKQNSIAHFIKNIPNPLKIGLPLIVACFFLLYTFIKIRKNYTFSY